MYLDYNRYMHSFIFGIHCHQPIGNFGDVFETAYQKAYKPLIDFFYNNEDMKFCAHFSGILLEWFLKNKKDFIQKLQNMSQRHQLEIIGGGYYEPILATISREDRILQIEKLNNFCENILGQRPKGVWLTERIWDSSVIKTLIELSMDYIIIDDYHIKASGHKYEEGVYITEEEGEFIHLIPIDKNLRYKIPFDNPENVVGFAKSQKISIIVDDGEKFGIWPHTYETVYEQRWLERFFGLLKETSIKTSTISEAITTYPKKLVYPAGVSYPEMGHWSLNYEEAIQYEKAHKECKDYENLIKGGVWKNFFCKYEESNYMHKRMLEVSKKSTHAKDIILKAQCNDAYWHGIFGGVYFPHLRREIWNNIIKADFENEVSELLIKDIDFDGIKEIKIKNKNIIIVCTEEGIIKEFSKKDVGNLNVCLTRYKEFYHFMFTKSQETTKSKTIHELEKDIIPYKDLLQYDDKTRFFAYDDIKWKLQDFSKNHIFFKQNDATKHIELLENGIKIDYKANTRAYINIGIHSIKIEDKEEFTDNVSFEAFEIGHINIRFSKKLNTKIYSIKTVSQSEKDFDVIIQGVCVEFDIGGEISVEILC